jgi:hypothetical protein
MSPYGSLPNGFLTMFFGENDVTRPRQYNDPCWKIGKQLKRNAALFCPQDAIALAERVSNTETPWALAYLSLCVL